MGILQSQQKLQWTQDLLPTKTGVSLNRYDHLRTETVICILESIYISFDQFEARVMSTEGSIAREHTYSLLPDSSL